MIQTVRTEDRAHRRKVFSQPCWCSRGSRFFLPVPSARSRFPHASGPGRRCWGFREEIEPRRTPAIPPSIRKAEEKNVFTVATGVISPVLHGTGSLASPGLGVGGADGGAEFCLKLWAHSPPISPSHLFLTLLNSDWSSDRIYYWIDLFDHFTNKIP